MLKVNGHGTNGPIAICMQNGMAVMKKIMMVFLMSIVLCGCAGIFSRLPHEPWKIDFIDGTTDPLHPKFRLVRGDGPQPAVLFIFNGDWELAWIVKVDGFISNNEDSAVISYGVLNSENQKIMEAMPLRKDITYYVYLWGGGKAPESISSDFRFILREIEGKLVAFKMNIIIPAPKTPGSDVYIIPDDKLK